MTHRSDTGLTAARLRISDIPGRTHIRLAPGTSAQMAIELSGPESLVQGISWKIREGTLHISGPENSGGNIIISDAGPGFRNRMTIRGGRGGAIIGSRDGMSVIGDGIVITSGGGQTVISTGQRGGTVIVDGQVVSGPGAGGPAETGDVELTVLVPGGTPVQVSDSGTGDYTLDDLRGTLDLRIGGHSRIRAGAVRGTRIRVGGSADIEIASVLDALHASIAGSGRITVLGGAVAGLRLSVSGSGNISFAGTAAQADLDVSGSGRIRVDTVTGTIRRDVSGTGRIDVREQPRIARDDFWS